MNTPSATEMKTIQTRPSIPGKPRSPRIAVFAALAVFVVTFATFSLSALTSRTDTIWSLYLAENIVQTGNADLDAYSQFEMPNDYRVEWVNGRKYSYYPIGTPLLAAPLVGLLDFFPVADGMRLSQYLASHPPDDVIFQIEKIIASFLAALNCVIIFALARPRLGNAKALLVAGIFAFATPVWSVSSRGLWQHGPSMLCLSVALYLLSGAQRNPWRVALAGLPLAFSFLIRPTNAVSILVLTAYVCFAYRRYAVYFMFCLAIVFVPFIVRNYGIYGAALPTYYTANKLGLSPELLTALAGNLISPSRGLLVFSPIFILSGLGVYRTLRASSDWLRNLSLYIFAAVILHWLAISAFSIWYGGWSVGPRYFSDMAPFLTYLLIPALDAPSLIPRGVAAQRAGRFAFAVLLAASVFVHARSATDLRVENWNATPIDIDQDRRRLWDWSDILFLRGLCPDGMLEAPRCWR